MTKAEYKSIETYMLEQMQDAGHDRHHIYRVMNAALDIGEYITDRGEKIDTDVLIAACLLHDIGREKQYADKKIDHAYAGGQMAYDFLMGRKWPEDKANHVKECILSHRYRSDNPPQTIEAKILFDADKLDAAGAMGIARVLIYCGQVNEPLYILDEDGGIVFGGKKSASFVQEYNYKLKKLYDAFHTERAKELAAKVQKASADFYEAIIEEISGSYESGKKRLGDLLRE